MVGGCDEWMNLRLSTLGLKVWIWTLDLDKLPGDWKGGQSLQDVIEQTVQAICLCYRECTCGGEGCVTSMMCVGRSEDKLRGQGLLFAPCMPG